MQQENVDLEEYKMEPLKAVFRFDADEKGIFIHGTAFVLW